MPPAINREDGERSLGLLRERYGEVPIAEAERVVLALGRDGDARGPPGCGPEGGA